MFEMMKLPFEPTALEPYISAQTFEFHYGKHYKTYVETLNKLIAGTDFAVMSLSDIIKNTYNRAEYQAIFNNAGQVFNHECFWKSLSSNGGQPKGNIAERIVCDFGSYDEFKKAWVQAAVSQFGSGWIWLIDHNGHLEISKTANADTPIARGQMPLLTMDVWEHAYYLDYQNRRVDFANAFVEHLANWRFS